MTVRANTIRQTPRRHALDTTLTHAARAISTSRPVSGGHTTIVNGDSRRWVSAA